MRMHPFRPGQDRVPAEPREPGDLSEGLRPDWTLLRCGGGGCKPGSTGGPESRPVCLPTTGRTHGGFPALTPPHLHGPFFLWFSKLLPVTAAYWHAKSPGTSPHIRWADSTRSSPDLHFYYVLTATSIWRDGERCVNMEMKDESTFGSLTLFETVGAWPEGSALWFSIPLMRFCAMESQLMLVIQYDFDFMWYDFKWC